MEKKVSVIIPTYNRADKIKKSVKSVLEQTYKNIELIIIDDGSTDNTENVIKNIKDNRIIYFKQDNRGVSVARNKGIKLATANFIAFQDSDDEWKSDKIEKQMQLFNQNKKKIGLVYTGFYKLKGKKKIYYPNEKVRKKQGNIYKELLVKGNFIGCPTVMIRKDCLSNVGLFDIDIPQYEDWDLFIRISNKYDVKYLNEPLVYSDYSQGGVNEFNEQDRVKSLEIIISKHINNLSKKELAYTYYYRLGNEYFRNNHIKKARMYYKKAINLYKYNIKFYIRYLNSLWYRSS